MASFRPCFASSTYRRANAVLYSTGAIRWPPSLVRLSACGFFRRASSARPSHQPAGASDRKSCRLGAPVSVTPPSVSVTSSPFAPSPPVLSSCLRFEDLSSFTVRSYCNFDVCIHGMIV